jgi:hypothetical protein
MRLVQQWIIATSDCQYGEIRHCVTQRSTDSIQELIVTYITSQECRDVLRKKFNMCCALSQKIELQVITELNYYHTFKDYNCVTFKYPVRTAQ